MPIPLQKVLERLAHVITSIRSRRAAHFFIAWLRIAIGFAFLPAGLKKILGQPFTDPGSQGRFHEFLHAFHATGFFYKFVGVVQLFGAALLIANIWPVLGVITLLPVVFAILIFCWSTAVYPTATVVTFIFCGLLLLLAWEIEMWTKFVPRIVSTRVTREKLTTRYWRFCGTAIIVLYFSDYVRRGSVYRPRHPDWNDLSFILLVVMAVLPFLTMLREITRSKNNSSN